MKRIVNLLFLAAALVLTAASGVIHGRLSQRWGAPADVELAVKKMTDLPVAFGDWQMEEAQELQPAVAEILRCQGYVNRTYVNRSTGEAVDVAVILGPHGPTSVHTPEICYSGAGYTEQAKANVVSVEDSDKTKQDFWQLTLDPNNPDDPKLRVYYAWSTGEKWEAAEHPRWTYRGQPYLFKLQLASQLPDAESDDVDVGHRFLSDFVDAARPYLLAPERD